MDATKIKVVSVMGEGKKSAQAKLTRKQTAYEYIKEKILSCAYEPGTVMNEQTLCDEMELSRTPVRDALSRLEQEGLINIMPKKGFMVSAVKLGDINHIYEVRLLLEPYALLRYGHKLDRAKLERLQAMMEAQAGSESGVSIYDLDDAFHGLIMQAMNNRYLLETYENIKNLNRRLRVMSGGQVAERLDNSYREHSEIIDACRREDWEGAAQAMTKHLEAARVAAFQLLIGSDSDF